MTWEQESAIIQRTNPTHHSLPSNLYLRVWFSVRIAPVAELVEELFSLPPSMSAPGADGPQVHAASGNCGSCPG